MRLNRTKSYRWGKFYCSSQFVLCCKHVILCLWPSFQNQVSSKHYFSVDIQEPMVSLCHTHTHTHTPTHTPTHPPTQSKSESKCQHQTWKSVIPSLIFVVELILLKHIYYHVRIKLPVYIWCRIQHAWGWCTGITQRDVVGREVGGGFMSMYGKTNTVL